MPSVVTTLFNNTIAVLILLFHMVTLLPWSFIKRFILPKNRKDIEGEIMFITGAGSGIGRMMSIKFAELGAILICTDLNGETAEETANIIKSNGGKAYSYQLDVTDKEKVYALAETIRKDIGEVTMLVNNAGIVTGKQILDCPDSLMIKTMEVNTIAHFWTLKAFLRSMLDRNHGHIVTVASIAGHAGAPAMVDYCASKFGAIGIHDSLTVELTNNPDNKVKTTSICPFFIKTGMFDGVTSSSPITFPLLEVEDCVNQIVAGVLNDEVDVFVPGRLMLVLILKHTMPTVFAEKMLNYLQLHDQMTGFKGRHGKKTD